MRLVFSCVLSVGTTKDKSLQEEVGLIVEVLRRCQKSRLGACDSMTGGPICIGPVRSFFTNAFCLRSSAQQG
jgi:hypothetical protein